MKRRRDGSKAKRASDARLKPSEYQPSKAELEEDLSVSVSLEELAKAALSGGAKRKA